MVPTAFHVPPPAYGQSAHEAAAPARPTPPCRVASSPAEGTFSASLSVRCVRTRTVPCRVARPSREIKALVSLALLSQLTAGTKGSRDPSQRCLINRKNTLINS